MNVKVIKAALVALVLSLSGVANAGIIAVDDWWLQTDGNGGLRQNTTVSDIYFAVSKQTTFSAFDTYEAIDGYRFLTTQEAFNLWGFQRVNNPYNLAYYTYHGQGGWSGYYWEGKQRTHWAFADSTSTRAMMHSGNYETYVYGNSFNTYTSSFAGFVMIKDDLQANSVPEPSTLAIFALGIMGLASRRFKKK